MGGRVNGWTEHFPLSPQIGNMDPTTPAAKQIAIEYGISKLMASPRTHTRTVHGLAKRMRQVDRNPSMDLTEVVDFLDDILDAKVTANWTQDDVVTLVAHAELYGVDSADIHDPTWEALVPLFAGKFPAAVIAAQFRFQVEEQRRIARKMDYHEKLDVDKT